MIRFVDFLIRREDYFQEIKKDRVIIVVLFKFSRCGRGFLGDNIRYCVLFSLPMQCGHRQPDCLILCLLWFFSCVMANANL